MAQSPTAPRAGERCLSPKSPGDTVSLMNQVNQMWHYPGWVDTVSTIMKINGVHAHPLTRLGKMR